MITQEQLKEYLDYNSYTGIFTWKKKPADYIKVGSIAGCKTSSGYTYITVLKQRQLAHRYAWIYVNGDIPKGLQIDHINRNKSDNCISNLRLATIGQNQHNRDKSKNNTSGYKGIVWDKSRNKWRAQIKINNKVINLGRFILLDDAQNAYEIASKKYHPEYKTI